MKHVLFVDDDPVVLNTYRNVFSDTDEWDCYYAPDVLAAIDYLNYAEIDIIVTDLSMPVFNGQQILEYVKSRFPSIIRIIFSGSTDIATNISTAKLAHRFLSKPTSINEFEDLINKIYHLYTFVINSETRKVVGALENLPSLPDIYYKLIAEFEKEVPELKKIGALIASDVGMSATILKLVNSAYFGFSRKITSAEHAVSLLGSDLVKGLVLSAHLFDSISEDTKSPIPVEGLMRHSMLCAKYAKAIGEHEKCHPAMADTLFVAGMLHDVGQLILSTSFPDKYQRAIEVCEAYSRPLSEVETEILGVSHCQVGAYLLGIWGLPDTLIEATAYHHTPNNYRGELPTMISVLHLADLFTYEFAPGDGNVAVELPDRPFLESAGLVDKWGEWRELCSKLEVPAPISKVEPE